MKPGKERGHLKCLQNGDSSAAATRTSGALDLGRRASKTLVSVQAQQETSTGAKETRNREEEKLKADKTKPHT